MDLIFRWLIVGTFALLAFAGPLAWAENYRRFLMSHIEFQELDDAIAAGRTEEAAQLEREMLEGFEVELAPVDRYKLFSAEALTRYWGAWGGIVIGCSCGAFVLLGILFPKRLIAEPA